jgi:hypothetical protein
MGTEAGKDEGWLSKSAKLWSILAPAGLITSFVAADWCLLVAGGVVWTVAVLILVVRYWFPELVTRESPILGIDCQPVRVPRLRGLPVTASWVFALLIPTVLIPLRIWCWGYFSPLAEVVRFEPNNLGKVKNGRAIRSVPRIAILPGGHQEKAYKGVRFTLAKAGRTSVKTVRVESVVVLAEWVDVLGVQLLLGANPENVTPPVHMFANLDPERVEAEAHIGEDGKLTGGVITLDDAHPFAEVHVHFDGMNGVYRVGARITVTDERGGRKKVIEQKPEVYVWLHSEEGAHPKEPKASSTMLRDLGLERDLGLK